MLNHLDLLDNTLLSIYELAILLPSDKSQWTHFHHMTQGWSKGFSYDKSTHRNLNASLNSITSYFSFTVYFHWMKFKALFEIVTLWDFKASRKSLIFISPNSPFSFSSSLIYYLILFAFVINVASSNWIVNRRAYILFIAHAWRICNLIQSQGFWWKTKMVGVCSWRSIILGYKQSGI